MNRRPATAASPLPPEVAADVRCGPRAETGIGSEISTFSIYFMCFKCLVLDTFAALGSLPDGRGPAQAQDTPRGAPWRLARAVSPAWGQNQWVHCADAASGRPRCCRRF